MSSTQMLPALVSGLNDIGQCLYLSVTANADVIRATLLMFYGLTCVEWSLMVKAFSHKSVLASEVQGFAEDDILTKKYGQQG